MYCEHVFLLMFMIQNLAGFYVELNKSWLGLARNQASVMRYAHHDHNHHHQLLLSKTLSLHPSSEVLRLICIIFASNWDTGVVRGSLWTMPLKGAAKMADVPLMYPANVPGCNWCHPLIQEAQTTQGLNHQHTHRGVIFLVGASPTKGDR